jgi:hypothetical protein
MIETSTRVIEVLRNLNGRNYLLLKFAIMPPAEWFRVLRALPEAERLVARVKYLPDPVLDYLSVSPDPKVRGTVAFKPALAVPVQDRLADDPHPEVRRRLAGGRGTLRAVLIRLLSDPDEETRRRARVRLERGNGRIDGRIPRCRSRKYWGECRYPQWMVDGVTQETWADALVEQAAWCTEVYGTENIHWPLAPATGAT